MLPALPSSIIISATIRLEKNTPFRLISMILSHSSSVISITGVTELTPGALTRTSIPPHFSFTKWKAFFSSCSSLASALQIIASPPIFSIASLCSSHPPGFRCRKLPLRLRQLPAFWPYLRPILRYRQRQLPLFHLNRTCLYFVSFYFLRSGSLHFINNNFSK